MKILLFDMDGVLLITKAYHRALSETVGIVGRSLGYQNAGLTQGDIDVFESVGVTSEWESSAICCALMLRDVWTLHPNASINKKPPLPEMPMHHLKLPGFQEFFCSPEMSRLQGERTRDRARRALIPKVNGYSETQVESIQSLLDATHNIHESITHRIFQELVIGSHLFSECYGLEASFNVDGYLQTGDIPTLNHEMHSRLLAWLKHPDQYAAVFTLRPSKAPKGFFDTPEAEMGLKVVDLENLPLVGHGGLVWFAEHSGVSLDSLIKPSPVHVLAAIRHSLGNTLEEALSVSSDIVLKGKVDGGWQKLDGGVIYAFEDTVTGFQSAQSAQKVLSETGIMIDLRLMGVSASTTKQQALEEGGAAQVFDDLNQALNSVLK
jgi:hypothetical protein